jgi:tetratricopeptide (TPR) repeat protein
MAYYNPECYKFIGRAFWAHNFLPVAMFFLKRAKDRFYSDPELHYLLAYIYYHKDKNIEECKKSLNTCLEILPEYAPAKNLYLLAANT